MIGLLFAELRKLVVERDGEAGWVRVRNEAGVPQKVYLATGDYPEPEFFELVEAASDSSTGAQIELLGRLGRAMGHDLLRTYRSKIDPSWKTMDLLRRTQVAVTKLLGHGADADASRPRFRTHTEGDDVVVFDWYAPKKMCPWAKGVVAGFAEDLGDRVAADESFCMYEGDPFCHITFRHLEAPAAVV